MVQDNQSLDLYFRDIASSEPLSAATEVELARQVRAGSQEARDRLVTANLRFVIKVARKYQNYGVPLSELISAGNMGLLMAAERFDETRGSKFISYAVWWIHKTIHESLAQNSWMVRMPANRVKLLHSISNVSRKLGQTQGDEPEPDTIAEELDVSVEMIQDTLMRAQRICSLDASFEGDEGRYLLHGVADTSQRAPDAQVMEDSDREQVEQVLDMLDDREAEVLRLLFGLGNEEPLTLEEVGVRFSLTRERVRQIKERALCKLRHPRRRVQLDDLIRLS